VIRIPKIFHRVWLGGKPMPREFVLWGQSWVEHHPGWVMKVWTEENMPKLANAYQYERAVCLAQRADIVRYELMLRHGGVYLDTDLECIQNIQPLLEDADLVVTSNRAHDNPEWLSNAIFGCTKGHPAMAELVLALPSNWNTDTWLSLGPPFFTRVLAYYEKKMVEGRLLQPLTYSEYNLLCMEDGKRRPDVKAPDDVYAMNHHSSLWFAPSTRKLSLKESV
jgi:mannosyltransferase OCH1-like enzyme